MFGFSLTSLDTRCDHSSVLKAGKVSSVCRVPLACLPACTLVLQDFSQQPSFQSCLPIEAAVACLSLDCSKRKEVVLDSSGPGPLRIIHLQRPAEPSSGTWPNTAWYLWRA